MSPNGRTRVFPAIVAMLLLVGCSENPTAARDSKSIDPSGTESIDLQSAGPPDIQQAQDIRGFPVSFSGTLNAWDTSDVALVEAIRAEDGFVTIGLKDPASERTRSAGFRSPMGKAQIIGAYNMLVARGAKIERLHKLIGAVGAQIDPALAPELRLHPMVDYISPRSWNHLDAEPMLHRPAMATTATSYGLDYTQVSPWGVIMVRAPQAWDNGAAGQGARVLIIDTGHQRGHPDLPWLPTYNCQFGIETGCQDEQPHHGTHVFGIIAARGNTYGVVGVAPLVGPSNLFVWNACLSVGPPEIWDCPTSEIVAAIEAGVAWNVDVINISLSRPDPRTEYAIAIGLAHENDIVVVASAGNNGDEQIVWPAGYRTVFGVSGVNQHTGFAFESPCPEVGSNWGSHVELTAPFWALSTTPINNYEDQTTGYCGNSISTPHVTGVVAILRGEYPDLTVADIRTILRESALDNQGGEWEEHYGYGLVDAEAALELASGWSGGGGGGGCPDPGGCVPERPQPIKVKVTGSGR